jgi:hypothetical protein
MYSPINHKRNLDKLTEAGFSCMVTRRVTEQMNLIVNNVKITFLKTLIIPKRWII